MFEASTVYTFGPFRIPIMLVIQAIGVVIAFYWISYEGKKYRVPWRKEFLDAMAHAFLVGVLVYKFWPLTEEPLLFIKEPARLLFTSGGAYGIEAAILISSLWIVIKGLREKWLGWISIGWILFGYVIVELAQSLLLKPVGESVRDWGLKLGLTSNLIESIGYLFLVAILIYEGKFILTKAQERVGIILVGVSSVSLLTHSLLVLPANPFILELSFEETVSLVFFIVGFLILLMPEKLLLRQLDNDAF